MYRIKGVVSLLGLCMILVLVLTPSCSRVCQPGYEGTACQTESRSRFFGSWVGTDLCDTTHYSYTFTGAVGTGDARSVTIGNFLNAGTTVFITGQLDTANSNILHITNQNLGGFAIVNGTFTVNGVSLLSAYSIADTGQPAIGCLGSFTLTY